MKQLIHPYKGDDQLLQNKRRQIFKVNLILFFSKLISLNLFTFADSLETKFSFCQVQYTRMITQFITLFL